MKKEWKKILLAWMLCLTFALTGLPLNCFADDAAEQTVAAEQTAADEQTQEIPDQNAEASEQDVQEEDAADEPESVEAGQETEQAPAQKVAEAGKPAEAENMEEELVSDPVQSSASEGADKTSCFHTVISSQRDTWSSGVTAVYSVKYTIDQGSLNKNDYVYVTLPQDIISDVDWSVSPQHFKEVQNLENGQYKLIFGADAHTALSGSFTMNLTMNNAGNSSVTESITVAGTSKPVTVNPSGKSQGGTSGRFTDAIVKDATGNEDISFGDYDYSAGYGDNAKQIGIIKSNTDGRYAFRLFINRKKAVMDGLTVTDILPGGMHFDTTKAPEVNYWGAQTTPVDASLYSISTSGGQLVFSCPETLNRETIEITYYVTVDDTKNAKYTNNADITYMENGSSYSEHTGYVLQGSSYSAANGEKQVDKTSISNDPADQDVTYSFKFWDNNMLRAGEVDFTDQLDSHVKFKYAIPNTYFSIEQDKMDPQVIHIRSVKDIEGNHTEYARFVVDMSDVPGGYTVANKANGNTVYTTKDAQLVLQALKTLDGKAPGEKNIYTFTLMDEDGNVLQTKENNASGAIRFDALNYGKDDIGKTYIYKIAETAGTDSKVVYDSSVYTVKVLVQKEGNGLIAAVPSVLKDGESVAQITFENKTKPNKPSKEGRKNPPSGGQASGDAPKPTQASGDAPKPTQASGDAAKPTQASGDAAKPTQASGDSVKPSQNSDHSVKPTQDAGDSAKSSKTSGITTKKSVQASAGSAKPVSAQSAGSSGSVTHAVKTGDIFPIFFAAAFLAAVLGIVLCIRRRNA